MSLRRLKWIFLLASIPFLIFLEWARHVIQPHLDTWQGGLLMDAVILIGILFFFGAAVDVISRIQGRLERRNQELLALHRASLDIYGELSLKVVLQKVVDQACHLLEARYGAVSVVEDENLIKEFVVSGVSEEERQRIGPPPQGHGLLGVVLKEGQRLRLADITQDARFVGMPEGHPAMRSLLAVPIRGKGPFRGNLYVAEKKGATEFSQDEEETLVRFATTAAIAIDNAYLHQRLQALAVLEERIRIAREMHDGMAQVLAYVNTKAQAVKEFLRKERTQEASAQLEQLAKAAREVYSEAREGILALRTAVGPDRSLAEALEQFLERWQEQSGIPAELEVEGTIELPATAELQLLRIIQEALSNIRKHSQASVARVELRQVERTLYAAVEDDGKGFSLDAKKPRDFPRFGQAIMKERAESIGGLLQVTSAPGEGTRVSIELPLTA